MNHENMIEVIKAHKEGKKIKWVLNGHDGFCRDDKPGFNFGKYDYEIMPEPLECWVNVYEDFVRSHPTEKNARNMADDALRVAVHMVERE